MLLCELKLKFQGLAQLLHRHQMDIQLKEFAVGRPLAGPEHTQLRERIHQLEKEKKFDEVFKQAQKMDDGLEKYLIIVNALHLTKKWQQLVEYCDKGLKFGDEAEFYHLKGRAIGKLGNDKKKVELINKAIQINPNVAAYHRNIGAGYYTLKQYEKAIQHHQKAIELEPNNSMNYHNLGSAYFRLKDFENARKEFDLAIEKNPKQALSFSWKGDCLKEMGQFQDAKACYQKAYGLTHGLVYLKQKQKMEELITKKKQEQNQ